MLRFYAYFGINPCSVVQFRMYPGKTEFLARVLKMLRFGFKGQDFKRQDQRSGYGRYNRLRSKWSECNLESQGLQVYDFQGLKS